MRGKPFSTYAIVPSERSAIGRPQQPHQSLGAAAQLEFRLDATPAVAAVALDERGVAGKPAERVRQCAPDRPVGRVSPVSPGRTALASAAMSLATTARPLAIASRTTFGRPSRSPGGPSPTARRLHAPRHIRPATARGSSPRTARLALQVGLPRSGAQTGELGPVADDAQRRTGALEHGHRRAAAPRTLLFDQPPDRQKTQWCRWPAMAAAGSDCYRHRAEWMCGPAESFSLRRHRNCRRRRTRPTERGLRATCRRDLACVPRVHAETVRDAQQLGRQVRDIRWRVREIAVDAGRAELPRGAGDSAACSAGGHRRQDVDAVQAPRMSGCGSP